MNSSTASFEILPFRSDGVVQSEEVRRRVGGISARSPGAIGPRSGIYHGPHRPPYGLRRPIGGYGPVAVQAGIAPDYTQAPATGAAPSEQIRWVQLALNQIMNANLPADGFASPDLRTALRDFQGRNGLPASGFAGPDTIAALRHSAGAELEWGWENMVAKATPNGPQRAYAATKAHYFDDDLKKGPDRTHFLETRTGTDHIDDIKKIGGLYRITFRLRNPQQPRRYIDGVYIGMSEDNLHRRIGDHVKEAREMGCDMTGHVFKVLYADDPALDTYIKLCRKNFGSVEHPLRSLEYAIHELPEYYDHAASRFKAHVTMIKRELEIL
jgi:Putative peptidoglycan binding domain